jgi:peptidylprolyl isomerase
VSTSQQRRDAERRRLQDQLDERRAREASRQRFTLIASIVTTLVVIAAIVVVVIVATNGSDDNNSAGGGPTASTVTFQGVTVRNAGDIDKEPKVVSKGTSDPKALQYKDLLVGGGKAASPASTVTVQYTGVLYRKGTQFDSSWSSGQPAQFSLAQVVPGFTQGIGGNGTVPPMKAGGRRLIILPPALGYGAQSNGAIPANSTLVFVVDLKSVDG